MKAYIFPGQGAQFCGMGKNLFDNSAQARDLFSKADQLLGFAISEIMFTGTEDELRQTKVTQPAVFIHSVLSFLCRNEFSKPDMVAGHSLGEFSALVANESLTFEAALLLVSERAQAMQLACELTPSTMAAVLGLDDKKVEEICHSIHNEIVVAANYNCPGQLVISGSVPGVQQACDLLKAAGAKRALMLNVGGAFHSPLMEPARERLEKAIMDTEFNSPVCPVYQNFTGLPESNPDKIKENLMLQLTGPVRWSQSVSLMAENGASEFIECGPGNVLQGLCKKIVPGVVTAQFS